MYLLGNQVVITSTDCQQGFLYPRGLMAARVLTRVLVDHPRQSPDCGMHCALDARDVSLAGLWHGSLAHGSLTDICYRLWATVLGRMISAVYQWGVPPVRRGGLALLSPSRDSSGVATSLEDDDCWIYLTSLRFRDENRSMEMMDGRKVRPSAHHSSNGKYGPHRRERVSPPRRLWSVDHRISRL